MRWVVAVGRLALDRFQQNPGQIKGQCLTMVAAALLEFVADALVVLVAAALVRLIVVALVALMAALDKLVG